MQEIRYACISRVFIPYCNIYISVLFKIILALMPEVLDAMLFETNIIKTILA